ncbi:MAG: sodium:solute symporter [Flavobacteriales bacterium]|nr:sodium:solute symporter [Flavobacteriales bacterium]
MSWIDWVVLMGTLLFIVIYGSLKTSHSINIREYFLGDYSLKWWQIGISVMATQASAITFISTPGQAYEDGMRFVQFYFGLPLAMIFISAFIIPIYYGLKVYTAYEFLESRFSIRVRQLTAFLFLTQRGLASGITIYAPSIILSSILGWDLNFTNVFIGVLVIIYTVSGGSKAVNITQRQQMAVMMGGMLVAMILLMIQIGREMPLGDALLAAGASGKFNLIDWRLDLNNRYTIWTGIIGGFFLSLSYFGTDQSQVGRYLGGKSLAEVRLGLLFNGIFKIPMQLLILFTGVLVFVFFHLNRPPVFFNQPEYQRVISNSSVKPIFDSLNQAYEVVFEKKQAVYRELAGDSKNKQLRETYNSLAEQEKAIRQEVKTQVLNVNASATVKDGDYIFIFYVIHYLPIGLVGLLFAVIFSAAMSSTSSELNALASTSMVDFYKRSIKPNANDKHYVRMSKIFTAVWGVVAIIFATIFSLFDNLIEAVNIIGSLFYGSILGVFLVGFFLKHVGATPVLFAALLAQTTVLVLHGLTVYGLIDLAYLWYNLIGCLLVILLSVIFQLTERTKLKDDRF